MSRSFYYRDFRVAFANRGFSPRNSPAVLGFSSVHLVSTVRSFSKCHAQEKPFMISYLIDSCGLSAESAQSVSKRIDFKNPDRPDSVLSLLKNDHGFSASQISKLVKKAPQVLVQHPSRILSPKLQFLSSIGVSSSELPEFVCYNPNLLLLSLKDNIIPNYKMLKSVLGSQKKVIQSLKSAWFASCLHKNLPANIALLREIEVSQQHISFLLIDSPHVLSCDGIKFIGMVNKAIDMGINPFDKVFVRALQVFSKVSPEVWEKKMEAYKSWGLSEEEILSAFRKHPYCMSRSVKKIAGTMDLIVNKMQMSYKAIDVINCPSVFDYSLEKRIVPRFSVLKVLRLKGLLKSNIAVSSAIATLEKHFLSKYVIKYEDKIPQLLHVYQGKMSIKELGYDFDVRIV